jgi:hypothetical protein
VDDGHTSISYINLKNKGTHSEITVEVGSPGQPFDVVADTGSNSVIVSSCVCQENLAGCTKGDACFTGTGKSSTFLLEDDKSSTDGARHSTMAFGSGEIDGVIAEDVVKVGNISNKHKGVFLMTESRLNVPIAGILGLGVPGSNEVMEEAETSAKSSASSTRSMGYAAYASYGSSYYYPMSSADADDIIHQIMGGSAAEGAALGPGGKMVAEAAKLLPKGIQDEIMDEILRYQKQTKTRKHALYKSTPGFLEQAAVGYFDMCFNEGKDGYMGVAKTAPAAHRETCLESLGKAHWGIGLYGISMKSTASEKLAENVPAKKAEAPAKEAPAKDAPAKGGLCSKMEKGMDSPCGAIIDSGTTVITGPEKQVTELKESICDAWPQCKSAFHRLTLAKENAHAEAMKAYGGKVDPFGIDAVKFTRSEILDNELAGCGSHASLLEALDGLPTLNFKLCASAGGKCQELELPGHMYVIEQDAQELGGDFITDKDKQKVTYLEGIRPGHKTQALKAKMRALIGGAKKVCSIAFDVLEMSSKNAGPTWIFGTPFFYQYKVGYSLQQTQSSALQGGAVSRREGTFGAANCISFTQSPCVGKNVSLSESTSVTSGSKRPLQIQGKWRRPSWVDDF